MDQVSVSDDEIRSSGSKSILARCTTANEIPALPAVLAFVQGRRARQDETGHCYVIVIANS
jgi:hypothetical protein